MSVYTRRTDHVAVALERRAMPFQLESVANIVIPIAEEIARLEAGAWSVFDSRLLDNATGYSLRMLGRLVNELEGDDGDEGLRFRIRLKARAIRSNETRLDFEELLALIVGTSWGLTEAPGWVIVVQNDATLSFPLTLSRILAVASADGVLVDLVTNEEAGDPFQWPSDDGDETGSAWDSDDGAEAGAYWQGVRIS